MSKLSVVIQAGGQSTRMGQDKALVPFLGVTMIEYILSQVEGLGNETLIITNDPRNYEFLGLPTFGDLIPNWGALGGLYSAIHHATHDWVLLLACDMPIISQSLLAYMLSLRNGVDAIIPRIAPAEFAEPFRAVYNKSCLGPIKHAIDGNQRRVISFFDDVDIRFVGRDELTKFDPDLHSFLNANTPEELAAIEEIARQ
jgi:molybdopterin-guanine dinucleotide biosynthesis protein A